MFLECVIHKSRKDARLFVKWCDLDERAGFINSYDDSRFSYIIMEKVGNIVLGWFLQMKITRYVDGIGRS